MAAFPWSWSGTRAPRADKPRAVPEAADAKEGILPHEVKDPKVSLSQNIGASRAPCSSSFLGVTAHQISSCSSSRVGNCVVCAAHGQKAEIAEAVQVDTLLPEHHHSQSSKAQ